MAGTMEHAPWRNDPKYPDYWYTMLIDERGDLLAGSVWRDCAGQYEASLRLLPQRTLLWWEKAPGHEGDGMLAVERIAAARARGEDISGWRLAYELEQTRRVMSADGAMLLGWA